MFKRDEEFYQELRDAGHKLMLNEDGEVDFFAMSYEFHNGPMCELCHESWCEHRNNTVRPCTHAALEGEYTNVTNQKALPNE